MPPFKRHKYYRPKMTKAGLAPTHTADAVDQYGKHRDVQVAGESPLTLKVDDREVVTLMTLGTYPEELSIGFLRNQRLIEEIEDIQSVEVNWDKETVDIRTTHGKGIIDWEKKLSKRAVTSGCGQGTVFSCTIDKLYEYRLPKVSYHQSKIYRLIKTVAKYNKIYKQAGGVHGCGLCKDTEILIFVEDVGRHNAVDAISGRMWLDRISGEDKIFYTLTMSYDMKLGHIIYMHANTEDKKGNANFTTNFILNDLKENGLISEKQESYIKDRMGVNICGGG